MKVQVKRVAVCISGGIRTFTFPCTYLSIAREVLDPLTTSGAHVDVFIVFNLADQLPIYHAARAHYSDLAMQHLSKALDLIGPKRIYLDTEAVSEPLLGGNSQLRHIDRSFRAAEEYSGDRNYGKYDYMIRLRPDFAFFQAIPDLAAFDENTVYSCVKFDAPASDQMFVVSDHLYQDWWKKKVRPLIETEPVECPEYVIFKDVQVEQRVDLAGGLVRDHEDLALWGGDTQSLKPDFWRMDKAFYERIVAKKMTEDQYVESVSSVVTGYKEKMEGRSVERR